MERTASFSPAASLTEQIADHIAEEIIRGRMVPQERIRELRVARALGVSRGSVREALLLLERRHLIEIVPRRGAVVADLSRRQLDDLFDLLETLYGRIAQHLATLWDEDDEAGFRVHLHAIEAAARADDVDAFSDAVDACLRQALAIVRNQYLDAVIDALTPISRRALHRVRAMDDAALVQGAEHWRAFIDAIASGDRTEAQRRIERLFANWREDLTRALCH